jgi:predicted metal-dependent hydrolase
MQKLPYLNGYPQHIQDQVLQLIASDKLSLYLNKKYPIAHSIRSQKALYDFTIAIQREYLKKTATISKVSYDKSIHAVHNALGLHTFVSRVQGKKLKAKHEIRIANVFRGAPLEFLRMISVHEIAHLKEKDHNKAFYQLCCYMEPNYHQLELDTRIYLTHLECIGPIY